MGKYCGGNQSWLVKDKDLDLMGQRFRVGNRLQRWPNLLGKLQKQVLK